MFNQIRLSIFLIVHGNLCLSFQNIHESRIEYHTGCMLAFSFLRAVYLFVCKLN